MNINHVAITGTVNNLQDISSGEACLSGITFDLVVSDENDKTFPISVYVEAGNQAGQIAYYMKVLQEVTVVGRMTGSFEDGPYLIGQVVVANE